MIRIAAFVSIAALVVACEPPQQRTSFPLSIAATLPTAPNVHGWSVTLDEATLRIQTLRFFPGRALLTKWQRVLWAPIGGVAHAHPGHFEPGEALAEWSDTTELDLLSAAPIALGNATALTGTYGSLEVTFAAPHDVPIRIAGTATKDATTIRFAASLMPPQPIAGIASEHELTTDPSAATIRVAVSAWLARVDFSTVGPPDDDGVSHFPDASQALNAFTRGVVDPGHWSVEWADSEAK